MSVPTIKVVHPDDDQVYMVINESDFDPEKYVRWDEDQGGGDDPVAARTAELRKLKAADLQGLCATAGIEYQNKDQAVDDLVAVEFAE